MWVEFSILFEFRNDRPFDVCSLIQRYEWLHALPAIVNQEFTPVTGGGTPEGNPGVLAIAPQDVILHVHIPQLAGVAVVIARDSTPGNLKSSLGRFELLPHF